MPGSDYIDDTWVRLGIGHEPLESIVAALQFSLNAARDNRKAA
jgi:cystathionine beta-lyase/cystathionine gamma-synthase